MTIDKEIETATDPILAKARGLVDAIEPERDLWMRIEPHLTAHGGSRGWRPQLAAAAGLLVVVTAAVSFWLGGVLNTPEPLRVAELDTAMFNRFGPGFVMGPDFSQTRMDLSISVADRMQGLAPETRAVVAANLQDISRALDEINAALVGDPGNHLLQQLLMSTYTEELMVLREIDALTRSTSEGIEI
jgi:hypothetical protein